MAQNTLLLWPFRLLSRETKDRLDLQYRWLFSGFMPTMLSTLALRR